LVTLNTLSKLLEATRVQDMTFVADSLSSVMALTVATVDMTLKDSIKARRKILDLGGQLKRMWMN
jgi:hypothetical protein